MKHVYCYFQRDRFYAIIRVDRTLKSDPLVLPEHALVEGRLIYAVIMR